MSWNRIVMYGLGLAALAAAGLLFGVDVGDVLAAAGGALLGLPTRGPK